MKDFLIEARMTEQIQTNGAGERLSLMAGILVALVGAFVCVGWATNSEVLISILPGFVPMNPLSAILFLLAGTALARLRKSPRIVWTCATLTTVVGAARLLTYLMKWDFAPDVNWFHDSVGRVHMATSTALSFLLTGLALLVAHRDRNNSVSVPILAMAAAVPGILVLIGCIAVGAAAQDLMAFTPMSLPSAVCFIALCIGITFQQPAGLSYSSSSSVSDPPRFHRSLKRKITFGLASAVLILSFVAVVTYRSIYDLVTNIQTDEHSRQVLLTTKEVLSIFQDLETGQRGYVISGMPEYLQPYQTAVGSAMSSIDRLAELVKQDMVQSTSVQKLRRLAQKKIEITGKIIVLRQQAGLQAARNQLLTGDEKAVMDQIRIVLAQVQAAETKLLHQRSEHVQASAHHTVTTIFISSALALMLVTLAGWMIRRDIAARIRAEQAIADLNQQLCVHSQQLEAANKELESFCYSVSHDLRAPLRGIDGFSQALLEDCATALDAQGREFLDRIRAAAQRMGQLIDDLLNLSRVTRAQLKTEELGLTTIAEDVLKELAQTQPQRQIELVVHPAVTGMGDPALLRIVLVNLLGNAWKFTGKVQNARIEFGIEQTDQGEAFFVRDNGAGFDMSYVHKLFGAFQRLHATTEFPGTGIGLATVQRIIHRHGGQVWAQSQVGQGASFYFTLGASSPMMLAKAA